MYNQADKSLFESIYAFKSNETFLKLISDELAINHLLRSSRHITSQFLSYANDIIFYALCTSNLNKKISSTANKILKSNNYTIKSEILKTECFKKAIEFLLSQSDSNFNNSFVSRFASITENYLLHSPELIENELSFFISFSPFIISNSAVYMAFYNLLDIEFANANLNSDLIYKYLRKNHFIDFLFENISDRKVDLLVKCAQIDTFRSPRFIRHLLDFESKNNSNYFELNNRKWEIIAKYTKTISMNIDYEDNSLSTTALSDFTCFIEQALLYIEPTDYEYSLSQVSALQFLSILFKADPINTENAIINISCLLETLKNIIIKFPNHSIVTNEVFLFVEVLIQTTSTRSKAIQVFIPILYELLMYQKIRNSREPKNDQMIINQSNPNFELKENQGTQSNDLFPFTCKIQEELPNENNSSPINCRNEEANDILNVNYNEIEQNNTPKDDENMEDINLIKKISNCCLRGFASQLLNRIMEAEDNDPALENELNDNDLFQDSIEYLIEVYNPLSESGYGYKNSNQQYDEKKKKLHSSLFTNQKRSLGLINRCPTLII